MNHEGRIKKLPSDRASVDKQQTTLREEIPEKFKSYLGEFGPQLFDSGCGEPVAWGYPIIKHLGEPLWAELGQHGRLEYGSPGKLNGTWVLVTKTLTREEAISKYGPVTNEERGPRGGFRSVTFGTKIFFSRYLRD